MTRPGLHVWTQAQTSNLVPVGFASKRHTTLTTSPANPRFFTGAQPLLAMSPAASRIYSVVSLAPTWPHDCDGSPIIPLVPNPLFIKPGQA
eukprot:NODE_4808_length_447_cov_55.844221_g4152_i0.p1 GENE.NODE_4808_length_447_cov_55.844221_g4152_i0~~NODE_4808_length_447_cov_55.844221_g4152_i0.p1  ORF type:complete len:91 (+),score=13.15 NODE_4808_length_447_cov_55.844221_g4152_i0:79-351(+)